MADNDDKDANDALMMSYQLPAVYVNNFSMQHDAASKCWRIVMGEGVGDKVAIRCVVVVPDPVMDSFARAKASITEFEDEAALSPNKRMPN